jgi:hypothetical protein
MKIVGSLPAALALERGERLSDVQSMAEASSDSQTVTSLTGKTP